MNRPARILCIALIGAALAAAGDLETAQEHFDKGNYASALPYFQNAAEKGSKEAKYRLGEMYEKGLGVTADTATAMRYYKEASSFFAAAKQPPDADLPAVIPIGSDEDRAMRRFALNKIDETDSHARTYIERYLSSDFGLYAYKTNYFLPLAYSTSNYLRWSETGVINNDTYEHSYETEFQISVKKPLSFDLMGLNEAIVFAYTQKVWWQLYSPSAPFRETNYEPELFITFPSPDNIDRISGLKGISLGFVHESNGRGGMQSRSWNRLYLGTIWQHGNLFSKLRFWYRLPEDPKLSITDTDGDDNPDITNYLGYGDLSFSYLYGDHQFGLLLRNNLHFDGDNRGALALDWSYPLPNSEYSFWYLKLFSGYGESLIDYNRHVNKISFGLSFSRTLF